MEQRPFHFMTRRRALAVLAGGTGMVLAGFAARPFLDEAPSSGRLVLGPRRFATLQALARAHLPRGGAMNIGAEDVHLAEKFDAFLVDEPEANVTDLKLALSLVEVGPLLFAGQFRGFSNLPLEDATAHWASWSQSRFLIQRQASAAFRKFFSLVFFDDEQVWPHIGYPGPSLFGAPP